MSDETEKPKPKLTLSLGAGGNRPPASRGPKTVTVEVRKKRSITKPGDKVQSEQEKLEQRVADISTDAFLTNEEKRARLNALQFAIKRAKEDEERAKVEAERKKQRELERAEELAKNPAGAAKAQEPEEEEEDQDQVKRPSSRQKPKVKGDVEDNFDGAPIRYSVSKKPEVAEVEEEQQQQQQARPKKFFAPASAGKLTLNTKQDPAKNKSTKTREELLSAGKRTSKVTVTNFDQEERHRSLASVRRSREKAMRRMVDDGKPKEKVIREVIIPENITVGDLANRMSEKASDIVRALMKLGVMATINQAVDADTAELVVTEFGHKFKRVTEADVEKVIITDQDAEETLQSRPPVVTIMGHVDHGKTSLLDALRSENVASGEAGGITQHIGAYQVELPGKGKVSFIDTPGHEAFTEMRARGAKVTDIVVLVVAADDGIMPQTIEAINHAKAAKVPIIVAINKIDKPDANPQRVKNELLTYELVPEDMGGDVQCVEVSAKQRLNLDSLLEAILLQAEVSDLKANPERSALGTVIESRIDKGRGVVATVIVQRGTLKPGDIVVAGTSYGRVRVLLDYQGKNLTSAPPSTPAEILGFGEPPMAGDEFSVVESDKQAREITEYRLEKAKSLRAAAEGKTAMEKLMAGTAAGEKKRLAVVIKGDVQGSIEAISGSLEKLANAEVEVKVIHSAVGAVTESDITLARASNALVVAFNVRANAQAREIANRDKVQINYYSIIYEVIDDVKALLGGLMSPVIREQFIGYATIREVFNITKVGKVAGCYVTEGFVKRGAGVRLLRDNVVIHQGKLKTLKRFKDEVKEVQTGYECGMAFENYDDVKANDVIECYEIIEEKAVLAG
jgi:translation initiation factor IF-2